MSREAAMQSASTQSRGWRLFSVPRRIALGILSLDLLVLLIGTAVLSGLRVEARRKAEHAWSSLVSTLERDLSRHLGQIDLSLRGLAATIQISEPGKRVSQSYEIALSAQAGPGRTDGLLLVLDANGTLVASSKAFSSAEQSFAGREYFEVHRQRREVGAYVSLPDTSDRGTQGIAISRRIASPDGLFRGLVVAQVPLTDLERIMSRLDLGADGTVSLLRTDGQLLARYPAANDLIVRDTVATVRRLGATLSTASAQFIATAESDGLERLYTYQRLGLPRLYQVSLIMTCMPSRAIRWT